uniref:Protein SZT2 n=1 Tax=Timema cristinae TaxID=61476 RepID=A0A7R9H336_TIMCR|nr:unnamed protein product [Timema cristinae]
MFTFNLKACLQKDPVDHFQRRCLTLNGQRYLQSLIIDGGNCKPNVTQSLAPPTREKEILEAGFIYLFMTKEYRISRSIRSQWLLEHLNKTLTVQKRNDIQHGEVMIDEIFQSFKKSLDGLTRPFYLPGSCTLFTPEIYITVIAHTPFYTTPAQQVLVQGWRVTPLNLSEFLDLVHMQLLDLEDAVSQVAGIAYEQLETLRVESENLVGGLFDENVDPPQPLETQIAMVSPDTSFINMLRYGILASRLLPESGCANIIVVTDGIVAIPDIHVFDSVLTQLRTSAVACSFLHVGSLFHPYCGKGLVPYIDLMQFISAATLGTYMTNIPTIHVHCRQGRESRNKHRHQISLGTSGEMVHCVNLPPLVMVGGRVKEQAPYGFLHDITCLFKKPFKSQYRQSVVSRFWATLKTLNHTDQLLVHLHSFCNNSAAYTVPEGIRSGMPVFYLPANSSMSSLTSSDTTCSQFTQFWRPICLMEPTVWQKWLHMHRLSLILQHDHPLPKHLHLANSSGRFQVVQCRQAAASLYALFKDWCTFALIENHSYVKLLFRENDKPPFSFYMIRVTSKPPFVVIIVAFLVGTPARLRHEVVEQLKERISLMTVPQRPANKEPLLRKVSMARLSLNSQHKTSPVLRTCADISCCVILEKPIEKILIRYERMPTDFTTVVFPDGTQPPTTPVLPGTSSVNNSGGGGLLTTLSRYLHHRRWVWAAQNGLGCSLGLSAIARILSTITKMRLQEGFCFAHSTAGIINMVLEVQMKTSPAYRTSFVVGMSSGSSSISTSPSSSLDRCCSLIISSSPRVPQTVMLSAAIYSSYVQSGANICHVSSLYGRVKVRGADEGAVDVAGCGSMEGHG